MKKLMFDVLNDVKEYAKGIIEILFHVFDANLWNLLVLIEIVSGIFFSLGLCTKYYLYFLIGFNLIVISYQDIKYKAIYSPYVFLIFIFAIMANPVFSLYRVVSILFYPAMFYIMKKTLRITVSTSLTELIAAIGALIGFGNLTAMLVVSLLFIAGFYAALVDKKVYIPLTPFLASGFVYTLILMICSY